MAEGRDGVSAALTSYVIRHKYVLPVRCYARETENHPPPPSHPPAIEALVFNQD